MQNEQHARVPNGVILLDPRDNCLVVIAPIRAGQAVEIDGQWVRLEADLGVGHKIARHALSAGQIVLKYAANIGSATEAVAQGGHLHGHNLRSNYTNSHSREDIEHS